MVVAAADAITFCTIRPPLVRFSTSVGLVKVRFTAVVVLLATFREFTALPPAVTARAVPLRRMFWPGWLATKAVPS